MTLADYKQQTEIKAAAIGMVALQDNEFTIEQCMPGNPQGIRASVVINDYPQFDYFIYADSNILMSTTTKAPSCFRLDFSSKYAVKDKLLPNRHMIQVADLQAGDRFKFADEWVTFVKLERTSTGLTSIYYKRNTSKRLCHKFARYEDALQVIR